MGGYGGLAGWRAAVPTIRPASSGRRRGGHTGGPVSCPPRFRGPRGLSGRNEPGNRGRRPARQIVFIGIKMRRAAIEELMDKCLLTDDELAAYAKQAPPPLPPTTHFPPTHPNASRPTQASSWESAALTASCGPRPYRPSPPPLLPSLRTNWRPLAAAAACPRGAVCPDPP